MSRLRTALSGKLSPAAVEENARYYEEYINTQMRLGEAEEEVLASLGDPRLIARSIVAAESAQDGGAEQGYDDIQDSRERGGLFHRLLRLSSLPSWALPVLAVGGLLVFLLIAGILFRLALHVLVWLWPLISIAMLVIFFIKLFRDWLH